MLGGKGTGNNTDSIQRVRVDMNKGRGVYRNTPQQGSKDCCKLSSGTGRVVYAGQQRASSAQLLVSVP